MAVPPPIQVIWISCWGCTSLQIFPALPGLRLVLCIQLPVLLIGQLRGILVVQGLLHGELDQQSDAVRPVGAPLGPPFAPRRERRENQEGNPLRVERNLEIKGPANLMNAGQRSTRNCVK